MTKYCTKRRSVTISGRKLLMLFRKKCPRLKCAAYWSGTKLLGQHSQDSTECEVCILQNGNMQKRWADNYRGPYRKIHETWIKRTLFFCPRLQCISKLPRYLFIIPYKIGMTLTISPDVVISERLKKDLRLSLKGSSLHLSPFKCAQFYIHNV